MTATSNPNAQPRKQLSDQLDRLDGILDALSDGLHEAVASAVEAAVGRAVERAVQSVLSEVIYNPAVRDVLGRGAAPATPPPGPHHEGGGCRPSLWATTWQRIRSAGRACAAGLRAAGRAAAAGGVLARLPPAFALCGG